MPTLLLADDSLTIQRVIELTFADEGVRVISVSDGQSAIARLETEQPDIVLADVGMPNVDGYQVAAHVKATPGLARVPVLLLTGAFEPIDEARAREAGCDGVLVKPFEPQQLVARVKELLGTGAPEKPGAAAAEPARGEPATVTPFPVPTAPLRVAHGGFEETAAAPQPLELPTRPIWETAGDRGEMNDRIGGATKGQEKPQRILEGLLGQDPARSQMAGTDQ